MVGKSCWLHPLPGVRGSGGGGAGANCWAEPDWSLKPQQSPHPVGKELFRHSFEVKPPKASKTPFQTILSFHHNFSVSQFLDQRPNCLNPIIFPVTFENDVTWGFGVLLDPAFGGRGVWGALPKPRTSSLDRTWSSAEGSREPTCFQWTQGKRNTSWVLLAGRRALAEAFAKKKTLRRLEACHQSDQLEAIVSREGSDLFSDALSIL